MCLIGLAFRQFHEWEIVGDINNHSFIPGQSILPHLLANPLIAKVMAIESLLTTEEVELMNRAMWAGL